VTDVRRIVDGLRPPALDELGLVGSLREEVRRLQLEAPALSVTLEAPEENLADLPAAVDAPVNGLQLYYETHGSGRPLVLLHGGVQTIDLSFGPLLKPLAASRHVIAVAFQGHGHTADTERPMTIEALAGDVVALLDHLGIAEADFYAFSLGGLVARAVALGAPARVGKLIAASADARRPAGWIILLVLSLATLIAALVGLIRLLIWCLGFGA
jgi:pimeloyl-ACP methyl ester carboxylesterase